MTIFHRCHWAETGRAKLPAVEGFKTGSVAGYELTMAVLAMYRDRTAIHLRCEECGEVTSRILDGWIEPTLPGAERVA